MTDFTNKDKIEEAAMKILRVNMTEASITVEDLPRKYMGLCGGQGSDLGPDQR